MVVLARSSTTRKRSAAVAKAGSTRRGTVVVGGQVRHRCAIVCIVVAALAGCGNVAMDSAIDTKDGNVEPLSVPYAFYNDAFGVAAGYVYGFAGKPQPQASVIGTAIVGSKGSAMGFLTGQDLLIPGTERLFIDPVIQAGFFRDNRAFVDGNPDFRDERAGSNGSDQDNFIEGDGVDNFFNFRLKYILPIGDGVDQIVRQYDLEDGLLIGGAQGGSSVNPLKSGRSFVQLRPFYRSQEIDSDDLDETFKTNGADLQFLWDNRDYHLSPSRGNQFRLRLSRDFGQFGSSDSWTVIEGEMDTYFDLGTTDRFRQRVLAFDVWTAHSPTREINDNGADSNSPPSYTGASLGGLFRMRGFPAQRFSDTSAIYYAAELRLIPDWNPFDRYPWLQEKIGVEWLQFVPFVEAGRVAPDYDLANLHSSMQFDAGFGIRAFAKGFVVRADTAVSHEGASVQMMIAQPFQF